MENRFYNSNNRAVIGEDGNVAQVTNYYQFGGVFSTTAYNCGDDLQPYKYNGKELDRTHGLDWYDYGARNYDAFLPMFTSLDPLCEKYYHISPYAYCANNPIKFIDPDGKKIEFAKGVSQAFKDEFAKAIQCLKDNKCDGLFAKLQAYSKAIYITETREGSAFNRKDNIIRWNPHMAIGTFEDKILTLTAVLNHEADHALSYITNPGEFIKRTKTSDEQYDNAEEKRAITGSEQRTALALGLIKEGEATRKDHSGYLIICKSPIEVLPEEQGFMLEESIITPNH